MAKYLLGIDVGTSACKVALFSLDGQVIASATGNYALYHPKASYVEQNPEEWWKGVCLATKACIQKAKVDTKDIMSVGVDGQSWSAIPMDCKGRVLHNTPIWMDTRAKDICQRTINQVGEERILAVSGNPYQPTYSTPKIQWFKENMPEVYKATEVFLQCNSYIAYKLTDCYSQEKSQGYGLHVYDIQRGVYDEAMADELGIDLAKLPPIYNCHNVVGSVTTKAAEETDLAEGTPVVAGGLDAACGTLGAGVYRQGQTQEQGGQAGGMSICLDQPRTHESLILGNHVVEGQWLLQGGTVGSGGTLNWFNRELGHMERQIAEKEGCNAFAIMSREAETIPVGSEGLTFLPYMAGERSPIWDEHAKGVFFGLDYSKTRAHMIRAIMEGVAYSLLHNLKTAEEIGVTVDTLHAMGGSANSRVWTQIKADVTGCHIHIPASDTATTWGAAILAGVGCGAFGGFEEAAIASVKIKRTHIPNVKNTKQYRQYYDTYRALYENLKGLMKTM